MSFEPLFNSLLPPTSSTRAGKYSMAAAMEYFTDFQQSFSLRAFFSRLKNITINNCFFYECCFTIWSWKFILQLILSTWSLVYQTLLFQVFLLFVFITPIKKKGESENTKNFSTVPQYSFKKLLTTVVKTTIHLKPLAATFVNIHFTLRSHTKMNIHRNLNKFKTCHVHEITHVVTLRAQIKNRFLTFPSHF